MDRTQRRALVVLLAVGWLAGAAAVRAQKDPQASFEPRSKPGAGQKFLEKLAGDWDVVKTFHPRSGDPVAVKGECKQTMIHDGRFLRCEFVFQQGDEKVTGLGIVGFEAESGLFTSVWTDSRSTRMSLRRSQDKFDGEQIVLYSQSPGDGDAEKRRSRTVTRLEDDGRKVVHRQYALDKEGKERLVMELLLTRKADAPPPRK
jgi:hypothetical protein